MNGSYQVVSSQLPVIFDGRVAHCFLMTLRNDVNGGQARFIIPGILYTFVIHQDEFGHHNFTWPSSFQNATPIDTNPLSVTVQTFIGTSGNVLQPIVAGTWTEREP